MQKQKITILFIWLLCFTAAQSVFAKVGDPRPAADGELVFTSHIHTVTATNKTSGAVIWKTTIPMGEYRSAYDPSLEKDVQWNIITSIEVAGDRLKVMNGKGEIFFLDKKMGKISGPHHLMKGESFPTSLSKSRKAIITALREKGEEPAEFYAEVEAKAGQIIVHLWHQSAFDKENAVVIGNPGGKCRDVILDSKTQKINQILFWQ